MCTNHQLASTRRDDQNTNTNTPASDRSIHVATCTHDTTRHTDACIHQPSLSVCLSVCPESAHRIDETSMSDPLCHKHALSKTHTRTHTRHSRLSWPHANTNRPTPPHHTALSLTHSLAHCLCPHCRQIHLPYASLALLSSVRSPSLIEPFIASFVDCFSLLLVIIVVDDLLVLVNHLVSLGLALGLIHRILHTHRERERDGRDVCGC